MPGIFRTADGRWRAGWGAAARIVGLMAAVVLFQIFGGGLLQVLAVRTLGLPPPPEGAGSTSPPSPQQVVLRVIVALLSVGIILAYRRGVDRRSVRGLGFGATRGETARFGIGLLGGFSLVLAQVGLVAAAGAMGGGVVDGATGRLPGALGFLLAMTVLAFFEELLVRGYVQTNIERAASPLGAVLIAAGIFAVLHGRNPNLAAAPPFALPNIFLGGVFLGAIYVRTRSLPAVTGVHLGWNFLMGPVLGIPVSGIPMDGLLELELGLPSAITGGVFGLEAGLLATLAMAAAIPAVWLLLPQAEGPGEPPDERG